MFHAPFGYFPVWESTSSARRRAKPPTRNRFLAEGNGKELTFFFLFRRGFRLCGGDQGAFRSPPGPLRGPSLYTWTKPPTRNRFLVEGRKRAYLSFPVSQRVSPLRRRPGGFPVAPWTPSGPIPIYMDETSHKKQIPCGRQETGLPFFSRITKGFASAEATRGLSGRPLDSFGGGQKLCHDAVLACCETIGFTFTWAYKKRARFSAAYGCGRSFRSGHALFIAFSKLPDGTAPAWGKSPTSPPASAG